ncbi:hypothetical protein A2630_01725 [Candidatus Woesebacteria bacterium RIFCSPHIGHO2_01_FULL_44_10]|nr:MAG: hypothetical protein A2630_01725 [Candidatus Woesebacteria bacterium RIFCSPHIGHO2_01_FULL_44_10]OGM56199.1 MAG: hypothetical protein A3F62_04310 [Candidatus Woesebacteria bacterium RIFCSPHIGHO2_12_FULL_44_11]
MKIKKLITLLALGSLLIGQMVAPISVAYAVPDLPSTPETPDSPDSPDSPDEPETPELPGATPTPTPVSTPTPTPVSTPTPTPLASPEPGEGGISDLSGESQDNYTGNDPYIDTGDSTVDGSIVNTGNTNLLSDPDNGGDGGVSILNEGNGDGSDNSGVIIFDSASLTIQDNDATVDNSLILDSATGENSTSRNTNADNTIETGDANVTGTILNALNTNVNGVMVSEFNIADDHLGDFILDFDSYCISGCDGGSATITNQDNGSDSTNTGEIEIIDENSSFQTNTANVENEMILFANSGDNIADNNTGGDSTIDTGDANASGNVINFLNNNLAGNVLYGVVNIFGDLIGDIILPEEYLTAYDLDVNMANLGNGDGSSNTTLFDQTTNSNYTQFNNAQIINNIDLAATTGDNTASDNTGGDSFIDTGDADIDARIVNIANSNIIGGTWWIVLVNEAGNWVGRIMGAPTGLPFFGSAGTTFDIAADGTINITNEGNGDESTNTGSLTQTTTNSTTQVNEAFVTNNISLGANTGGNSTSRNTGGDNRITTGDASVMLNLINFVNNNFAGANVIFTVVNVFGNWFGDFVGPGYTQEAQAANNPGVGGYTSNNQSDISTDVSISTNGTDVDVSVTNTANTNATPSPTPEILGESEAAGESAEGANEPEVQAADEAIDSAKKKIKINLAWAAVAIVPVGLYLGLKKFVL